jgi:hypothetical protein
MRARRYASDTRYVIEPLYLIDALRVVIRIALKACAKCAILPVKLRIHYVKCSVSRKSDTTFGQGTIQELSTSHIGKGVALVALAAAFVYIYARIPQIAEMTLSFHATLGVVGEVYLQM